jgi:hypothetical protein
MLKRLYDLWLCFLDRLVATKPARFAVIMVAAALVFLVVSEQGQDVVRALAERQSEHNEKWQRISFFAGVLAWSLSAWYWARAMLRLAFPGVPGNVEGLRRYRTWMPRWLGALAAAGVAAALWLAAQGYSRNEHPQVRALLQSYALWCFAGATAFFVAVSIRRDALRFLHRHVSRRRQGPVVQMLDVKRSAEEEYGTAALRSLGAPTLGFLAAAIIAAVALLLVFVFRLQDAAPAFGTAAIMLFAATGWIAAGSALDVLGMKMRVPVFLGLFALAVLFSPFNDNHAVRTLAAQPTGPETRLDVRALLREWMQHQPAKAENYPLFLVNAEGGGIRAAYWTTSVLGEIQAALPRFEAQLFSLSGVSGGSLGVSVFAALLAERRAGNARIAKRAGQRILGADFLSPVTAALLYPDLVQRLLPFPVPYFDRARAIEESWEHAWRREVPGSDRFAEPMTRLRDGAQWAPVLFLNATWVETGKRIIASQAAIDADDFVDTEDAQGFFSPERLRLSTAVHMSARFTYVSPAGTLAKGGKPHGRVVDGGYFENSGATTTLEIAKTIDQMTDDGTEDPRWKRVQPIVIHISNEAVNPAFAQEVLANGAGHPKIGSARWMPEIGSPLQTLLSTREARGVYARETLRLHVGEENFFHFGLCRESTNAPLGWVLSRSTRQSMDRQLEGPPCARAGTPPRVLFDNRGNLERLRARS